ncbi:MAG: NAD(P)H-dependent glycerol-3-phosphate dehydrogenase [Armatimonadota bacterium]
MSRVAVLGAGSWGTALSLLLARNGHSISMWAWDPAQIAKMRETGENPFLPGFPLPLMNITNSIPEAVAGCDAVLFVTISSAAAEVARTLASCIPSDVPVVSATKGLSQETGCTISQTLESELSNPVVALSGPNLAVEVARGVPTATVAACTDESVARQVQRLFMGPTLRVYTNSDVIGVELAGALKNVIAVGAGICDGLGYGDNTKAALLTRGLAEITRLGVHIGAKASTFMGLAGVGDLIATCASPLSRNRRVGLGLGEGRPLDVVVAEIGQVAEGVPTTRATYKLAARHGVQMPITEQMHEVLFAGKSPREAVASLMSREPRDEVW